MAATAAARAKETRCERAGLAGCSREGQAGCSREGPEPRGAGRARVVSSGDLLRVCGPVVWDPVGGSESL